jgi:hypothetical protein
VASRGIRAVAGELNVKRGPRTDKLPPRVE